MALTRREFLATASLGIAGVPFLNGFARALLAVQQFVVVLGELLLLLVKQ